MKVVEEKVVTFAHAKDLLQKRKKDTELGYEQQNTLEYLEKFAKLSEEDSKKLAKELEELNILSEKQIMELVNLLPGKEDLVRTILSKEKLEFSADKVKEIAKIIKPYTK
ncbi:MAG: RNA polymerase Rpb4 family protein [Candidatus Micrarchaeota archaeon]